MKSSKVHRVKLARTLFQLVLIMVTMGFAALMFATFKFGRDPRLIGVSAALLIFGFVGFGVWASYSNGLEYLYAHAVKVRRERKFRIVMEHFRKNDLETGLKLMNSMFKDFNISQKECLLWFVCGNYIADDRENIKNIGLKLHDNLMSERRDNL